MLHVKHSSKKLYWQLCIVEADTQWFVTNKLHKCNKRVKELRSVAYRLSKNLLSFVFSVKTRYNNATLWAANGVSLKLWRQKSYQQIDDTLTLSSHVVFSSSQRTDDSSLQRLFFNPVRTSPSHLASDALVAVYIVLFVVSIVIENGSISLQLSSSQHYYMTERVKRLPLHCHIARNRLSLPSPPQTER